MKALCKCPSCGSEAIPINPSKGMKRCPFCGSEAIPINPKNTTKYYVTCNNDDCAIITKEYPTKAKAIIAWNTRARTFE